MFSFQRTCKCGRNFRTGNPFRFTCAACEYREYLTEQVPLVLASNEFEAQLWSDILLDSGIPSVLKGGYAGFRNMAIPGGYKRELWVRRGDAERSQEVLALGPRRKRSRRRQRSSR